MRNVFSDKDKNSHLGTLHIDTLSCMAVLSRSVDNDVYKFHQSSKNTQIYKY